MGDAVEQKGEEKSEMLKKTTKAEEDEKMGK